MQAEPTISRDVVVPILGAIRSLGGNVESLLDATGLARRWENSTTAVLPEANVWDLYERSAFQLSLPEVGLETGSSLRVRDLGVFGRRLEQSLSLFHCLNEYVRSVNHHSSHANFWLSKEAHGFWFCRSGIELFDVGRDYVEQFAIQLMIRLVQLASGPDWIPTSMQVEAATDRFYRTYDAVEFSEIRCSQPQTAIWIPMELMLRRVHRANDAPLTAVIRDTVRAAGGYPTLDVAAEEIGFSKRTIQRELSQDGLDWSRLTDQTRFDRAVELLTETDAKLMEIAFELGYTDAANFGRAFRRWCGVSPKMYRRCLQWHLE